MPLPDLPTLDAALSSQWDRLHDWLTALDDADALDVDAPSALDGWDVGELVSHLGRSLDALVQCVPTPPGTVPLTLAEYLGTYPERADEIAQATRELDTSIADDRLTAISRTADAAFAQLARLGTQDVVVQARRGPIRLHDMVLSRLVELVVHGDDLVRSLPRSTFGAASGEGPVDPTALQVVADALLDIVTAREGCDLEVTDPLLWVRLATGRAPYDVDELARALAATSSADSVPDLGRALPVL